MDFKGDFKSRFRIIYLAAFLVPLDPSDAWFQIRYSKIPVSTYQFKGNSLLVDVKQSAGPLIYRLSEPKIVKRLSISGRFSDLPKIPEGSVQGDRKSDDFILRIGVIDEGKETVSGFSRLFAPSWLVDLVDHLTPKKAGYGGLRLFLISNMPGPLWTERSHPSHSSIHENIIRRIKSVGRFKENIELDDFSKRSIGIWIGPDGDDTKSNFQVIIDRLEITFTEEGKEK
ncbi:MAG: hypothetical protein AB7F66_09000 [Bacteriovoracia bacterium]